MLLAQGFSIDMMVELINSGLATTVQTVAGGYEGGRGRVLAVGLFQANLRLAETADWIQAPERQTASAIPSSAAS
jgi:hypothetical protein